MLGTPEPEIADVELLEEEEEGGDLGESLCHQETNQC